MDVDLFGKSERTKIGRFAIFGGEFNEDSTEDSNGDLGEDAAEKSSVAFGGRWLDF